MWDDLTHLIALTIDRSDWIISEISRGKRRHSPVPFLNGELFEADSQICVNENIYIYYIYGFHQTNILFITPHVTFLSWPPVKEKINFIYCIILWQPISQRSCNNSLLDFTTVTF